jgi:hypothetical protein
LRQAAPSPFLQDESAGEASAGVDGRLELMIRTPCVLLPRTCGGCAGMQLHPGGGVLNGNSL